MHVVEGISDRVVALDHGIKIAEGTFERGRDHRRRSSRPTSAPAGWPVSELAAGPAPPARRASTRTTARSTSSRTSNVDVGEGELVCLLGGNASGQVDDAEDDPRASSAAHRPVCSTARTSPRCRPRTGSSAGSRSCPRTGACSAPMTVLENLEMGALPAAEGRPEGGVRARLQPVPAPLRAPQRSSPGRCRAASSRWSRWGAR